MNSANATDPFTILRLARDAGEAEIRSRYLELVKQFPPDRDPDKFREIRAAYEAIKDPLAIARRLLIPPGDEIPQWDQVIEAQRHNPPRLTTAFLLSLGNRSANDASTIEVVEKGFDTNSSFAPQQSQGDQVTTSESSNHEVDAR